MAVGSPSGAMRKLWNQTAGRRGGTGDVLDAPERRWKMGHFRGYEFHLEKKIGKDLGLAQQRNVTADDL